MPKPLTHLTTEQHIQAAKLLNQAQDNFQALSRIVMRAPYSDQLLRIAKATQELLIDPLREAWDADPARDLHDNPYQAVGYGARRGL
jgi:hypothetical protein